MTKTDRSPVLWNKLVGVREGYVIHVSIKCTIILESTYFFLGWVCPWQVSQRGCFDASRAGRDIPRCATRPPPPLHKQRVFAIYPRKVLWWAKSIRSALARVCRLCWCRCWARRNPPGRACTGRVQCTLRLFYSRLLNRSIVSSALGVAKRLGVAPGERSSRGGRGQGSWCWPCFVWCVYYNTYM